MYLFWGVQKRRSWAELFVHFLALGNIGYNDTLPGFDLNLRGPKSGQWKLTELDALGHSR
jgi:hypothetical protein